MNHSNALLEFIVFLIRHKAWSRRAAGEGLRTEALTKHIEKECQEARDNPTDRMESIDLCILSMELYFRQPGTNLLTFVQDLIFKMDKIESRQWPKVAEGEPMEHVRGIHD